MGNLRLFRKIVIDLFAMACLLTVLAIAVEIREMNTHLVTIEASITVTNASFILANLNINRQRDKQKTTDQILSSIALAITTAAAN